MILLVGILIAAMILNCVLLILLILVQLPKKDAGAGLAFGGGAADALFGAGSGNALTKITKWTAGIFFGLALVLGHAQDSLHRGPNASAFEKAVQEKQMQTPVAPQSTAPPASQPATTPSTNSMMTLQIPASANTNTSAAPVPAK
ncbi:MAG TPA: preprotein translocase subunit SecG [Verrucomicrobiae bacterium]|nr:preprotein translocase subunit SecG [Verrucomicrobiae bacterium]